MTPRVPPRIYNLFPLLVGPVEAWHEHLPRIAGMGFDWLFLNPFHYPGFSGSLYAVKDYYRLHPRFQGEAQSAPEALLRGLVAAAQEQGVAVMMDLVINHTAKDAVLGETHPQWYARNDDGSLKSPGAVDPDDASKVTVWGDLAELDYSDRPERHEMIAYWQDLVRHYAGLGIRGFRCDAAYKVPAEVWRAIIDSAREAAPEALFAAETLGCRLDEVAALREAGFDFLFNSAKWWDFRASWLLDQYEEFRHIAPSIAFPESHDTERLVAELERGGIGAPEQIEAAYRQRYLFAAMFSTGVMVPIGYEYGFGRKLNVVGTTPDDWEQPRFDLGGFIAEVNRLKASLPALAVEGPQTWARPRGEEDTLALLRETDDGPDWVLTVLNPNPRQAAQFDMERIAQLLGEQPRGSQVYPQAEGTGIPAGPLELGPLEARVYQGARSGD